MRFTRRALLGTTVASSIAALAKTASAEEARAVPEKWDHTYEIVIIGTGAAGCSAAIAAAELGASVAIVEKNSYIGGNSILSGGGFNAAVEEDSEKAGVKDSPELHFEQSYAAGDKFAYPDVLSAVTENAPDTVRWLKSIGMQFTPIYQIYGGLYPRARNPIGELSIGYYKVLVPRMKELNIPIYLDTKVLHIIREGNLEGRVLGIEAIHDSKPVYFRATKGVIVAAGGYAANAKLCARFDPRMAKFGTTNNSAVSTGEMLLEMMDIGAGATGLDFIQCIPGAAPGYQVKGILTQSVNDFIFVNKEGKRFINEDARRDQIRDAVLDQTDGVVFNIVDADGYKRQEPINGPTNEIAIKKKALFYADTLEELAEKLKIPPDVFKQTVEDFNKAVDEKKDPMGRSPTVLTYKIEKPPFYGGPIAMARHHTMGGVTITPKAQVIDRHDKIIPGLYAAGEVTGGVHGTNRVGGNGIADAYTMGRIAGKTVAESK